MGKGLKICNLNFEGDKKFDVFEIDGYKFSPINKDTKERIIYKSQYFVHYHRKHKVTCKVIVPKKQNSSIIFKDGRITNKLSKSQTGRKRKFLEDVLLLISLLIGRNVVLYSRRYSPQFPALPFKSLKPISSNSSELKVDLQIALTQIKDNNWQEKYDNGFHLIMLYYHANILHSESRFLANFVIWEWLYTHLEEESRNLRKIFSHILQYFWGDYINGNIFNKDKHNIFTILRNQLAHGVTFPINRPYADEWMKNLNIDGIMRYLDFFDKLTQVLVLKTLGLDCESRINAFDASLNEVLNTGKITIGMRYSNSYY